ncbi:alpha/beta hydrolase [Zavarzinia sp. CC-PAN008]|uniref:alpha/beta hydrolase n=1 Tax=Zavarzinia sp. CC-PAN008 TaxID=3243332 RepID=UPI003F74ACC1
MPEIIFNGPAGRLEGRYQQGKTPTAPMALILHAHPQFGATMNNKVVYNLFHAFAQRGFAVLRFNFRGVGRSQGAFDNGQGELADAASALDWLQTYNPNAASCWVAGYSFGSWIGMQLLMRRPEIAGFISVSPPASRYDFTFLAPCPSSGLIVHGSDDQTVQEVDTAKLADRLAHQRGIKVTYKRIEGASHFYEDHLDDLNAVVNAYLDGNLKVPV